MKFYHEASKIVKPKLEALAIAEGQMDAANKVADAYPTFRPVVNKVTNAPFLVTMAGRTYL